MEALKELTYQAISQGVSEETIVLLILLPLVASIVAATRHLIGFRGFGILIPTALSVVFVAMGITSGLLIFVAILLLATIARVSLRKLHIQYLPRMALLLWFISLGVLGMIFIAPASNLFISTSFGINQVIPISIFPILILILLAEEFIAVQIGKSLREATQLTLETIVIALIGWFIFRLEWLNQLALNQPHWTILVRLIINLLVGRYTGLRLLEYQRFKRLLK